MNRPIRLALGVVVLVAERIQRGPVLRGATVVGLGLIEEGTAEVRAVARRALTASTRIASSSIGRFAGPRTRRGIERSRRLLTRVTEDARRHGEATIAAARADATAVAQDGITWAQTQAVPQFVDGLLPHLIDRVLPRLIDDTLPEVRRRVLPTLIEDLAHDQRIRELALSEGERAVTGAAQYLRNATAGADDRVENAIRHFGHRRARS
jgi:hypothetical protein